MPVSRFDKMTTREARIEWAWGVIHQQLVGFDKSRGMDRERRIRLARKAIAVSPELQTFVDVLSTLFKPERKPVRKRMENAKVPRARTREVIQTFTKDPEPTQLGVVETTLGGATVIRLPTFAGRETEEIRAARRALIERAAKQIRMKPSAPPEAS